MFWLKGWKSDSYHTLGGTNGMKILHVGDPMV
jgi:pyruvate kinase